MAEEKLYKIVYKTKSGIFLAKHFLAVSKKQAKYYFGKESGFDSFEYKHIDRIV